MKLEALLGSHFTKQEVVIREFMGDEKYKDGFFFYQGNWACRVKAGHFNFTYRREESSKEWEIHDLGHDGYHFATAKGDDTLDVWDVSDSEKIRAFVLEYATKASTGNVDSIFSGLFDGTIWLYEPATTTRERAPQAEGGER